MIFMGITLVTSVIVGVIWNKVQHTAPYPPVSSTSLLPAPPNTGSIPTQEPSKYAFSPKVETSHWVSWSILDVKSGVFSGSADWAAPNYTMSMIKPWIVADYLRFHPNPSASTLNRLSIMILDSDNQAATDFFGGQASMDRFVKTCGLTDLVIIGSSWSRTGMSARDAVRYGQCIYSGAAAGSQWTPWIVDKMEHVRGAGDFGPRALFTPRSLVATKNGWQLYQGQWYINCLSVTDDWAISVLQKWTSTGESYDNAIKSAEAVCNSIASQVLKLS